MRTFHVIPVGDTRTHMACEACVCKPFNDGHGSVVHHAFDGREYRERIKGIGEKPWVVVEEKTTGG